MAGQESQRHMDAEAPPEHHLDAPLQTVVNSTASFVVETEGSNMELDLEKVVERMVTAGGKAHLVAETGVPVAEADHSLEGS